MKRVLSRKNRKHAASSLMNEQEEPLTCLNLAPFLSFLSFLGVIICLYINETIGIMESIVFTTILLILSFIMKFIKTKSTQNLSTETNIKLVTSDESSYSYNEINDSFSTSGSEIDSDSNFLKNFIRKYKYTKNKNHTSTTESNTKTFAAEDSNSQNSEKLPRQNAKNSILKNSNAKKSPFLADISDENDDIRQKKIVILETEESNHYLNDQQRRKSHNFLY